jgi:hypothetical protein
MPYSQRGSIRFAETMATNARSSVLRKNSWRGINYMSHDYIVDEIRQIREELAAKYAFDIKAIFAAAKKRQRKSGHKIVAFAQKKSTVAVK